MKILITGSTGQLGYKLSERLASEHQLCLTDSQSMDITDLKQVMEVVSREKPDCIIHAAAYTAVDKAEANAPECERTNDVGTLHVALAAKKHGAKLVYISTDFVFDGTKRDPYTESDAPNPLSVYGSSKYQGELRVKENCDAHYIIRVSWLFGEFPAGRAKTNFVETMLRLAREKSSLSVVCDQIGSPTYTGDVADIVNLMLKRSIAYGTYHVSGAGPCSWYEFAQEIFKQTNTIVDLKPIANRDYPQKAARPAYSYLDKSKIEAALDIKVRPWQEMLTEYLRMVLCNNHAKKYI